MPINQYSSARFDELEIFHIAEPKVADKEKAIWELGSLICEHGLEGDFGITFLHKHFEIQPHERLVRRYRNRLGQIAPEPPSIDQTACIWGFDKKEDNKCHPLEFSDRRNMHQSQRQSDLLSESDDFVAACGRVITEHKVENLFGVASLHGYHYFAPKEGEAILESSGKEKRTLKLDVVDEGDLADLDSSPTLWVFKTEMFEGAIACPIISPEDSAAKHCYHCGVHCRTPAHCDH